MPASPVRHVPILVETIASEEPLFLSSPRILGESRIFGEKDCAAASLATPEPCVATRSLLACVGAGIYDSQHHVAGGMHAFFQEYWTDEPSYVTLMELLFSRMFSDADRLGGQTYELSTFNLAKGARHPETTSEIADAIAGLVDSAEYAGRICKVEHRHARNFIIDSRNGFIHTGRWPEDIRW